MADIRVSFIGFSSKVIGAGTGIYLVKIGLPACGMLSVWTFALITMRACTAPLVWTMALWMGWHPQRVTPHHSKMVMVLTLFFGLDLPFQRDG